METKYEDIAIYVDDLLIASDKPQQIIKDLKEKFKLKIKRDGPLEYYLDCDYKLDKDNTLVAQPIKYINKILESYKKMFPDENFQVLFGEVAQENFVIGQFATMNSFHWPSCP